MVALVPNVGQLVNNLSTVSVTGACVLNVILNILFLPCDTESLIRGVVFNTLKADNILDISLRQSHIVSLRGFDIPMSRSLGVINAVEIDSKNSILLDAELVFLDNIPLLIHCRSSVRVLVRVGAHGVAVV